MVSLCNDECLFSLTGGPRDGHPALRAVCQTGGSHFLGCCQQDIPFRLPLNLPVDTACEFTC